MVASFTPNVQLTEPARGDDVGTWDTPVNGNTTLLDLLLGGIATIPLNNSNVVLNAGQFQNKQITFNSTLTGSVTITFPTSFTKSYEIQHLCTGSSAFTITLETTATGGQVICCPPGEIIDVINDGTNLKYKNMGRVGTYWDYAGSSVPNWVTGCTVPPWLNCAAGTFSAGTYPMLAAILGGTTLPDTRGRTRFALDQGTGRNTSVVTGNTIFTGGGDQFLQSHSHANTATVNDPTHAHSAFVAAGLAAATGLAGSGNPQYGDTGGTTGGAATGITVTVNNAGAGGGGGQNLPPLLVHGLTLIRAA